MLRGSGHWRGAASTVGAFAKLLAVHRKILYGSENDLWDLVAEGMDGSYAALQEVALGVRDASWTEKCRATFELFEIAIQETWPLLDDRQRAIVGHARQLAAQRR